MSAADCKTLALKPNVFITKELVTSENRMHKESFVLVKFVVVESIMQLEVVLFFIIVNIIMIIII